MTTISFNDVQKNQDAFIEYVNAGNVDQLRAWKNIGPVAPQAIYRRAFETTARCGTVECMVYLLEHPHFYTTHMYTEALIDAVGSNNVPMAKILLPFADPRDNYNLVLRIATLHRCQAMFDLLYPHCDAHSAQRIMREFEECPEEWSLLDERIESDRLQGILGDVVANTEPRQRASKI